MFQEVFETVFLLLRKDRGRDILSFLLPVLGKCVREAVTL